MLSVYTALLLHVRTGIWRSHALNFDICFPVRSFLLFMQRVEWPLQLSSDSHVLAASLRTEIDVLLALKVQQDCILL